MRHKNQISLKVESSVSGEQKDHFESCKFGFVTSDVWIRIDGSTETQNSNREKWNLTSKKGKSVHFYEKLHEKDNNNEKKELFRKHFCVLFALLFPVYLIKIYKFQIRHSLMQESNQRDYLSSLDGVKHIVNQLSSPTKLLMLM